MVSDAEQSELISSEIRGSQVAASVRIPESNIEPFRRETRGENKYFEAS